MTRLAAVVRGAAGVVRLAPPLVDIDDDVAAAVVVVVEAVVATTAAARTGGWAMVAAKATLRMTMTSVVMAALMGARSVLQMAGEAPGAQA